MNKAMRVYYSVDETIVLCVRKGLGDDCWIVGRWKLAKLSWASPVRFRGIEPCASAEECQDALDAYAWKHGLTEATTA